MLSRLIIRKNFIYLYVDLKKIARGLKFNNKIKVKDIDLFEEDISNISGEDIIIDKQISYFFYKTLCKKNRVKSINDFCKDLKSVKNITEIKNSRKAHLNDGIALVKFFYWLEKSLVSNISELDAANKLETYRRENKDFFL